MTSDNVLSTVDVGEALRLMEERKDAAYLERNQVVAALAKCFPSGIAKTAIEGWSEDWHGCVYIDLPTGQVSWHYHDSQAYLFEGLPPYTGKWDGHDTPEKYRRVDALAAREKLRPLGFYVRVHGPSSVKAYKYHAMAPHKTYYVSVADIKTIAGLKDYDLYPSGQKPTQGIVLKNEVSVCLDPFNIQTFEAYLPPAEVRA